MLSDKLPKSEPEVAMKTATDGLWIPGPNNDEYPATKHKGANKVPFIIGTLCRCPALWDCGANYVLVVGITQIFSFFWTGVAGGTASGKTTVCDMIIQQLHDHRVVLVNQDSFYRGLTAEEKAKVGEYNFDHPGWINTVTALKCLFHFLSFFSL